jgi:predicted lipid carrier protein YhbT
MTPPPRREASVSVVPERARARAVHDASTAFFEGLATRGHEPLLANATGTVRVELTDGTRTERWLVSIDKGAVAVSHRNVRGDCTIRAPKPLFDGVARGEVNAMAAVIRGAVAVEGDWELLGLFQRLFRGPGA